MPDRFHADPARPKPEWVPEVEISRQDESVLRRAGVPMQHPETRAAVIAVIGRHEKAAIVALLKAMADDVYTLENPPQHGSWVRRTLWRMDQAGIRDNYIFKGRLERLAARIESEIQ